MCHFAVQMHYNGDDGSSLIFVRWTGGVLALDEQAVRLHCCVRLKLNVSLVFNAVWGHNFTLIMWCSNTLQWRWQLCVDLRWIYGMVSCWSGRADRTFVLVCACIWRCYRCSMQCNATIMHALFKCTTIAMLIFVRWMYGILWCWSSTNSAYVCFATGVLEFEGVIGVPCSMRS